MNSLEHEAQAIVLRDGLELLGWEFVDYSS